MFDDDILIPPPREAKRWVCAKCGEPTGEPEPGMLSIDPRYAAGHCPCTPGRRLRVAGYQHDIIPLIADFAFDRAKWLDEQAAVKERKAFDKAMAGMPVTPEERVLAVRHSKRAGLADPWAKHD